MRLLSRARAWPRTTDALPMRLGDADGRLAAIGAIPRADIDMGRLQRTKHVTYCPYKGKCNYFSIPSGGERATNAAWTYEAPYDAVGQIKDHIAFYRDRVDSIDRTPG